MHPAIRYGSVLGIGILFGAVGVCLVRPSEPAGAAPGSTPAPAATAASAEGPGETQTRHATKDTAHGLSQTFEIASTSTTGTVKRIALADLPAAIAAALRTGKDSDRRQALEQLAAGVDASDEVAALALAGRIPNRLMRLCLQQALLKRLAAADPAAALRYATSQTPFQDEAACIGTVIQVWALADPSSAEVWLRGLDRPALRLQVLRSALYSLAQANPEIALRFIQGFAPQLETEYGYVLFTGWAAKDPAAATSCCAH